MVGIIVAVFIEKKYKSISGHMSISARLERCWSLSDCGFVWRHKFREGDNHLLL